MRRMKKRLEKAQTKPYDYIVVMGGTNDLGWGQPSQIIFHNLSESDVKQLFLACLPMILSFFSELVWEKALDSGASVVALNIIEAARSSEGLIKRRGELNEMIANHQHERL